MQLYGLVELQNCQKLMFLRIYFQHLNDYEDVMCVKKTVE